MARFLHVISIIAIRQNEYVSVSVGEGIILAVKRNGKVVTIGENSKIIDEVKKWENVTSIGIGYGYAVGGTDYPFAGFCQWHDQRYGIQCIPGNDESDFSYYQ